LCGCATYNIQQEKNGFAVARYKKVIPEYTEGPDGSFPDKALAEERFKRRKKTVEYYYKKMGFMDNRFKQVFIEPPVAFIQFIAGIFRMPFIMASDYKYNHNPQYKEKIDKLEDQQYESEKARIKGLKAELNFYIKGDLAKEPSLEKGQEIKPARKERVEPAMEAPLAPKVEKPVEAPVLASEPLPKDAIKPELAVAPKAAELTHKEDIKIEPVIEEAKPQETSLPAVALSTPRVIIIAKPQNGPSPLKVNFYGSKSRSANGKIISYEWNFGDGDRSNKPNPSNTYWSTTYGPREYTVTLTITDNKGMASSASTVIKVVNK